MRIAMLTAIRNQMIRLAFHLWARSIRAQRILRHLGRPRIGMLDHLTIPVTDLVLAREFYCEVLGAPYPLTVDGEAVRRFGRRPAPKLGEGAHLVSVYWGAPTRVDLFLQSAGEPAATSGHPHYAF